MADALDQAIAEIRAGKPRPLYLVWGEEFLARRAAEALCDALVPPERRDLNFVQLDAAAGGREVAQHLDTVPMFRGTKVVFVESADVLLAKRDVDKELARARELWNQPARKKDAARRVLSLVAPAGWTWRELDPEGEGAVPKTRWKKEVGIDLTPELRPFFSEVAKYCADMELRAPKDDAEVLLRSVSQGPPRGNHLVLLCEAYDPKHPVARAVEERGLVIERKAERSGRGRGIESLDIGALTQEVLGPLGKKISPGAVRLLKDRVGEAMRQMASELDKLALYVGDRTTIEERDVELLVAPLREEEFFELGNALGEGDAQKALKLVWDELNRGKHGLMILGGVTSSVRRLALDAARWAKVPGALSGRMPQKRDFETTLFPAYAELMQGERAPNAWATWMNYQRIRRHGLKKLLRALALCAEVDAGIKRGSDPELALERLILAVCGTQPASR